MPEPTHHTPKIGETIPNFEKPGYIKLPNGEVYKITVKGYQGDINYKQLKLNIHEYLSQQLPPEIWKPSLEKVVITDYNIACHTPPDVVNKPTKVAVKTLLGVKSFEKDDDPTDSSIDDNDFESISEDEDDDFKSISDGDPTDSSIDDNDFESISDGEDDDLDIIMEEMPEEGPKGLERFRGQTAQQCLKRMEKDARKKLEKVEYIRLGNKEKGVEPGFNALRAWRTEDTFRINDSDDDYYKFLWRVFNELKNKQEILNPRSFINFLKEKNKKQYGDPLPEKYERRLNLIYDHIKQGIQFGKLHFQIRKPSMDVDDLMRLAGDPEEPMHQLAKAILQGTQKEFTKLHFIKLDYDITGKWFKTFGTVGVPWEKAKAKKHKILNKEIPGSATIHKVIHWIGTHKKRREKNWGAVKEALANDIFELRQTKGQNLRLILTKYSDEYPMILLEGEEVEGPNGETYHDFEGHLLGDGEKQRIAVWHENELWLNYVKINGKIYPVDMASLATLKMQALFNGDYDKVGASGGNLGFIIQNGKAVVYNIDPGKSFDKVSKIDKEFEVNSDCSCYIHHKNFSMFNGALLSDEIQGVKNVLENHRAVLAKVDEYIGIFDEGELDFGKELKEIRQHLVDQEQKIRKLFGNRLDLSAGELNLLDDFEKQTSPTIKEVKFKERKKDGVTTPGGILKLARPEVVRGKRTEWSMKKQDNQYILSCKECDEEAFNSLKDKLPQLQRANGNGASYMFSVSAFSNVQSAIALDSPPLA